MSLWLGDGFCLVKGGEGLLTLSLPTAINMCHSERPGHAVVLPVRLALAVVHAQALLAWAAHVAGPFLALARPGAVCSSHAAGTTLSVGQPVACCSLLPEVLGSHQRTFTLAKKCPPVSSTRRLQFGFGGGLFLLLVRSRKHLQQGGCDGLSHPSDKEEDTSSS